MDIYGLDFKLTFFQEIMKHHFLFVKQAKRNSKSDSRISRLVGTDLFIWLGVQGVQERQKWSQTELYNTQATLNYVKNKQTNKLKRNNNNYNNKATTATTTCTTQTESTATRLFNLNLLKPRPH